MKNFKILLIGILATLSLNSCSDDDEFTFVAKEDPDGVFFVNSVSDNYVLQGSNRESLGERFIWNEVDLDVQTTVRYELQASENQSFDSFSVLGSDIAETNYAVKVGTMMGLAEDAGLDNDPETDAPNVGTIYFRVRAYAGNNSENNVEQISEPLAVNVELLEAAEEEEEELPKLYVVGNFQNAGGYGNDWTPEDGVPLAASAAGETDFEGFVYINVDSPEFKFLPSNEGWDGDYGDGGEDNGVFTGILEQEDEANAGTPDGTGGYYLVKVNTETMEYTLEETNWGVIGSATPTGWESDTDMTYDADAKLWTLTLDLTEQEAPDDGIKFRANDAWDLNIGDNDADGSLEFDGQNISVPEDGNYTVTMDLSNPRQYTYTLTKN